MVTIPCSEVIDSIREEATKKLFARIYTDDTNDSLHIKVCASCDRFATIENPMVPLECSTFLRMMNRSKYKREDLLKWFPNDVVRYYTSKYEEFEAFVLSPSTRIFDDSEGNCLIDVCEECAVFFERKLSKSSIFYGPSAAVWNGNMSGIAPDCLMELNTAEIALVSPNRILTHSIVLQTDHHEGIIGWHSMFENDTETHISNLQYLIEAGLKGEFVCVLVGPWTEIQIEKVRRTYCVRPEKVINAFEWLKGNNYHYRDIVIPPSDALPHPTILHHKSFENLGPGQQNIENEINVTILMPDSNSVESTNGPFSSQEEFRKYLTESNGSHIQTTFFTRPSKTRAKDYVDDEFVKAFPVQFPYGTGGFSKEKALEPFFSKSKNKQDFFSRVRQLLQTNTKTFHNSTFNLIANNILMRNEVFSKVKLQCNLRYKDNYSMGEIYGNLSPASLQTSIQKARRHAFTAQSTATDQFLNSISAVSQCLPHTNEAATLAQKNYFSFIVQFGLPALFVTISPDDKRRPWIQVALNRSQKNYEFQKLNYDDSSDGNLNDLYKQRVSDRANFPGLCAEEYSAICSVFISDILRWDKKKQKNTGIGLFGEVVAWTRATEEQNRKTLHGHFLIWIKGWNELLHSVMERKSSIREYRQLTKKLRDYVEHCASAQVFCDWGSDRDLKSKRSPFFHNDCRTSRREENSLFTVKPVPKESFAQMRTYDGCYTHRGHIATCPNCNKDIKLDAVMEFCINEIAESEQYRYDRSKRKLEHHVYEQQKDPFWYKRTQKEQASRLLYANALSNTHSVTHSKRCFKKSNRCYTSFPIEPNDKTTLRFAEESSIWTDFDGTQKQKYIFEVIPKRKLEDCFANTHNRLLTNIFGCNNNVIAAMTGAAVLYVTCYSVKKTQKEEREAFENVASVLLEVLEREKNNPESIEGLMLSQVGFRHLMLAIMLHTSSLIIAAPMAHHIAMNKSRYEYSHKMSYFPIRSLSKLLKGEPVRMHLTTMKKSEGTKPYCSAMNYLFRPNIPIFENLSPWEFWCKTMCMSKVEAKRIGFNEVFDFMEDHPKIGNLVVVFTNEELVPIIDWTFFGDAKSLTNQITKPPYPKRRSVQFDEDYCRNMLLCFASYRTEDDINTFGSYTKKFYNLYSSDSDSFRRFTPLMQNIQNIRNSLDAGRMESQNLDHEIDPDNPDDIIQDQPDPNETWSNLHAEIASYFNRKGTSTILSEPDIFDIPSDPISSDIHNRISDSEYNDIGICVYENTTETLIPATTKTYVQHRSTTNGEILNRILKSSFSFRNVTANTIQCTGTVESIIRFGIEKRLDPGQQTAFEVLTATVVITYLDDAISTEQNDTIRNDLSNVRNLLLDLTQGEIRGNKPLRLFITGPAGAGKSTILSSLIEYCQEFCRNIGCIFDEGVIRLTALTGAAATEIKGQTTHKECKLNIKSKISEIDIREWLNTRLLVVDEISFAGYGSVLVRLSKTLQSLTECQDHLYGKVAVVFIGDFLQLEPVNNSDCIYKFEDSIYWEMALNMMIELEGKWRFKDCPRLQTAFSIMREQGLTQEIRNLFNSRIVGNDKNGTSIQFPDLRKTKVATYTNRAKESFNEAIFMNHLRRYHSKEETDNIPESTIVIKGQIVWKHNDKKLTFSERKTFFEGARESNTKEERDPTKRIDPFLKLYFGCKVMINRNEDVANGVANGTTAIFEKIFLKPNCKPHKIRYNGYWVISILSEDIQFIKLRWSEDSLFRGTFTLAPKTTVCNTKIPVETESNRKRIFDAKVKILQLPISINNATTGHKLQGKSVDRLLIGEWGKGVKNWVYVVLSRVRKLENLYFLNPIPDSETCTPEPKMLQMMNRLRNSILIRGDNENVADLRVRILRETENISTNRA